MDSIWNVLVFWLTGRVLEIERRLAEQEARKKELAEHPSPYPDLTEQEWLERMWAPGAGIDHVAQEPPRERPKLHVVK